MKKNFSTTYQDEVVKKELLNSCYEYMAEHCHDVETKVY